jgi:hypothetical protein
VRECKRFALQVIRASHFNCHARDHHLSRYEIWPNKEDSGAWLSEREFKRTLSTALVEGDS